MRNIKNVLLGDVEQNHIKGIWDITPTVNTDVIVPSIVSVAGGNKVGSDTFVMDTTGVFDPFHVGVARTNINLRALENDHAFQIGLEVTDAPPSGQAFALGFYVDLPGLTDAAIRTKILNMLASGTPLGTGRIYHYLLSYGTTVLQILSAELANTATPTGYPYIVTGITPGLDVEIGSTTGLVLCRAPGTNDVNLGMFGSNSTDTFTDLSGITTVDTYSFLDKDSVIYAFALSADIGSGLSNVAFKVTTTAAPSVFDITGTSYAALPDKNQATWDAEFIAPITGPIITSTSQAVFPPNAKAGQFYKTVMDPLWNGVLPTPYGLKVSDGQTVLLTEVLPGSESFVAYVDNVSLETSVNEITQPIAAQQASQLQTIADLGTLVQQTQSEVNVALLNAPEVIVYIKHTGQQLPIPELNFSTAVAFDTLDEGYNYLISLPRFIKKRMVLDNRPVPYCYYYGVDGTLYNFVENNITISSYTVFTEQYPDYTYETGRTVLVCDCTALRLDKFVGIYTKINTVIPSSVMQYSPIGTELLNRIQLVNNVRLETTDNDIDFSGGFIFLGDWCNLSIGIANDPTFYSAATIRKGEHSYVSINNGFGTEPASLPWVYIQSDINSLPDATNLSTQALNYTFTGQDQYAYDSFGGLQVIRHQSQLGAPDEFGQYHIQNSGRYLFVKSLDFINGIVISPSATVELYSLNDSVEITVNGSNTNSVIENRGICRDYGLNLYCTSGFGHPAILNYGSYYRRGGRITADTLFSSTDGGNVLHKFNLADVDHFSYSGYYYASTITECLEFRLVGIRLRSYIGQPGYLTFNLNNITVAQYYLVEGIVGASAVSVETRGFIDLQGSFNSSADLADIFNINNIDIVTKGATYMRLITKNATLFDWKKGGLFNYSNKQHSAYAYDAYIESMGGVITAPVINTWFTLNGFNQTNNSIKYISSNKLDAKWFKITIKGNVYKDATAPANANARIYIGAVKPGGIGNYDVIDLTVALPVALSAVPFEATKIASLKHLDALTLNISLTTSTTHYARITELNYSVEEI